MHRDPEQAKGKANLSHFAPRTSHCALRTSHFALRTSHPALLGFIGVGLAYFIALAYGSLVNWRESFPDEGVEYNG